MKKILYISALSLLLFPKVAFADVVTTNTSNVPLQIGNGDSRVIMLIPESTLLNKTNSDESFYSITYGENSGIINKSYTAEGKLEEEKEQQKTTSNSSSGSYSGDIENLSTSTKMKRIVDAANKYGRQYGLDPLLVLALIKTESSFNPKACSNVNCRGLMQISYRYAPSWGISRSRLYEIEYNIQHGTRLLRTEFISKMGSIYDGLRAYNQGVNGAKKSSGNGKAYADKIMKYYKAYKQNGFTY